MSKATYLEYKVIVTKVLLTLIYFIFCHRKAVSRLSLHGLTDIRAFQISLWYMGRSKKGTLLRFFYTAQLNGQKCFVKVATNDKTIKREIFINKYIAQTGLSFVPKLLLSDEAYADNTVLLVTELLLNTSKFKLPKNEQDFESLCREFECIHESLRKLDIIHGDINASNIILDQDNHIILIDFGISWAPGSEIYPEDHINNPGTYYQSSITNSDSIRIYDNAFSFLEMLKDCDISFAFTNKECYKRIERLVGTHTYTVRLPKEHC